MGLRLKILSGFLVLSLMLIVAGIWSIYHFHFIGESVQKLIDNNYQSITATNTMINALEREDSAVLLLLLGKWENGRSLLEKADSVFNQGFRLAEKNQTLAEEADLIKNIKFNYKQYKELWQLPIVGTSKEHNLDWYFDGIHQAFLDTKASVNDLNLLHENELYRTSIELRNRANRATMPGIVAIITALIFTLMFSYLINYFMVNPIIRVINGITLFLKTGEPFNVRVRTKDEISKLVSSVQYLCSNKSEKPHK